MRPGLQVEAAFELAVEGAHPAREALLQIFQRRAPQPGELSRMPMVTPLLSQSALRTIKDVLQARLLPKEPVLYRGTASVLNHQHAVEWTFHL